MLKFLILFLSANFIINAQDTVSVVTSPFQYIPLKHRTVNNNLNRFDINKLPVFAKDKINYWTLAGVGALTLGTGLAVHIKQSNAWWRDQSSKFRIVNDWNYALWVDKIGHFYGTHLIAHGLSSGLYSANVPLEKRVWYSAVAAFAFQMYVEIEDGFGLNWGFSPGDAGADLLGAAFYVTQYYYPVLNNFQPKFSYYPTQEQLDGKRVNGNFIDDYEGQKYWIGMRMKKLLPKNLAKYWPSLLMISAGVGVKDLDGNGGGIREIYLALDLDVDAIPLYGDFWQFIKNTLNYIHFPMPGIRISQKTIALGFVY